MSDKCGKRCFQRGCQRPDLHPPHIVGNKWCPPCSDKISAGAYVRDLCERCCQMQAFPLRPETWESAP